MKSNYPRKEDIEYLNKYQKENNLSDKLYQEYLKELSKGIPVQYVIGNVNFYGYQIKVDKSVLIPRYETELLVDKTINKIKKYFPNQKVSILDLGTGSGCIAITLKKELESSVDALDISTDAINIASYNANLNQADINFINQDMTTYQEKKYDIIISNPPYIRYDEEIMDIVAYNEPSIALYAEDNGLYFYKKIIDNLKYLTNDKYLICFEIGLNQSTDIINYLKSKINNINISVEKDYSDKERFIFITNINS